MSNLPAATSSCFASNTGDMPTAGDHSTPQIKSIGKEGESQTDSKPFRILDLPAEMRNRIYESCFALHMEDGGEKVDFQEPYHALTRVSCQIRSECFNLFLATTNFRVLVPLKEHSALHFISKLKELEPSRLSSIKSITLEGYSSPSPDLIGIVGNWRDTTHFLAESGLSMAQLKWPSLSSELPLPSIAEVAGMHVLYDYLLRPLFGEFGLPAESLPNIYEELKERVSEDCMSKFLHELPYFGPYGMLMLQLRLEDMRRANRLQLEKLQRRKAERDELGN